MTDKITITKPDDWHLHLRDHAGMSSVVKDSARYFKRALIMPNLVTPIATVEQASAYRERILNALPFDSTFEPLMTLYLTAETTPDEIIHAQKSGFIFAVKLFPAGATTNSSAGIQTLDQCTAVFETMQKIGMPLSVHGEVTDEEIDIFDREKIFIERVLDVLIQRFPNLKIIMEHLTTQEAVHYVEESSQNLAATITPHHLLLNRNDLLVGGIKPHYYCLPIVKGKKHQETIITAATSGNPKFFLGTDSAPHPQAAKETAQGSAGIYSAFLALPLYTEIFESKCRLEKLEDFTSHFGADFYGIARNEQKITLIKSEFKVPEKLPFGEENLVPLKAGEMISWQLKD